MDGQLESDNKKWWKSSKLKPVSHYHQVHVNKTSRSLERGATRAMEFGKLFVDGQFQPPTSFCTWSQEFHIWSLCNKNDTCMHGLLSPNHRDFMDDLITPPWCMCQGQSNQFCSVCPSIHMDMLRLMLEQWDDFNHSTTPKATIGRAQVTNHPILGTDTYRPACIEIYRLPMDAWTCLGFSIEMSSCALRSSWGRHTLSTSCKILASKKRHKYTAYDHLMNTH